MDPTSQFTRALLPLGPSILIHPSWLSLSAIPSQPGFPQALRSSQKRLLHGRSRDSSLVGVWGFSSYQQIWTIHKSSVTLWIVNNCFSWDTAYVTLHSMYYDPLIDLEKQWLLSINFFVIVLNDFFLFPCPQTQVSTQNYDILSLNPTHSSTY